MTPISTHPSDIPDCFYIAYAMPIWLKGVFGQMEDSYLWGFCFSTMSTTPQHKQVLLNSLAMSKLQFLRKDMMYICFLSTDFSSDGGCKIH